MNNNWQEILLSDICSNIQYGYTASSSSKPVGPKFLRITDIVPNLIDWDSVPYCEIPREDFDKYLLKEGDIVIARTGATTGYAKYISRNLNAVFASYLVRIQLIPNVYKLFIGKIVESDIYKKFIKQNIGGAAQPNANAKILTSFPLLLPPLSIQKKIAGILSAYDDLIENNTRRIKILEEMAQRIYREWFVHFRYPGYENQKLVDSELGPIPENWEVINLEEMCRKVTDGTHEAIKPVEQGYHMVSGKDIINGLIDFKKTHYISELDHKRIMQRSKPEKGDIIFSKIGTLGSTAIVYEDFEFSIKNVALFKPKNDYYTNYMYLYFSDSINFSRLEKMASGTSQKFFSLVFLRNYKLIVPPKNELLLFNELVDPVLVQRFQLKNLNEKLQQTRDLLLPKLISGKIDVSSLDLNIGIDE